MKKLFKEAKLDGSITFNGADPKALSYFQVNMSDYTAVLNRERFFLQFAHSILLRREGYRHMSEVASTKDQNRMMVTIGAPGSGKTTALGYIVDIVNHINRSGEDRKSVERYLEKFMPEELSKAIVEILSGYIPVMITFNNRQPYDTLYDNDAKAALLGRIIHSIILSNNLETEDSTLEKIIEYVKKCGLSIGNVVSYLNYLHSKERGNGKYILCVDEFKNVADEKIRGDILALLGRIMDSKRDFHCIVTSIDPAIIAKGMSASSRRINVLPFNFVPGLVNKHTGVLEQLEENPEVVAIATEDSATPRGFLDNWIDPKTRFKRDYIPCLLDRINSIDPEIFIDRGLFNVEFAENFIQKAMAGKSVSIKDVFGTKMIGSDYGTMHTIRASELFENGMLIPFNMSYYINQNVSGLIGNSKLIPTAGLGALVKALQVHPSIQTCENTPALWGALMCAVRPWIQFNMGHNIDRSEILFALNDIRSRMSAWAGEKRLFSLGSGEPYEMKAGNVYPTFSLADEYDPGQRALQELPITVRPFYQLAHLDGRQINIVKRDATDLFEWGAEALLRLDKMIVKWNSENQDVSLDALSRLSLASMTEFMKGNTVLMNCQSGPGYDFALAEDNGLLTFVEVKYSLITATAEDYGKSKHGSNLSSGEFERKAEFCEHAFENARIILNDREGKLLKDWRLIIYNYRSFNPKELGKIKNMKLASRIHVFGPRLVAAMLPPTFANRLELAPKNTVGKMIDSFSKRMRDLAYSEAQDVLKSIKSVNLK